MAAQEQVLEGSVPVAELRRFSELLADNSGDVHLHIVFSRGDQGLTRVSGTVTADVHMECQNCLQTFSRQLSSELGVTIVRDEQGLERLAEEEDGYVCSEPQLSVRDLLEDELLLTAPMIPRHGSKCPAEQKGQESSAPAGDTRTYKPFAGLADAIKKQQD